MSLLRASSNSRSRVRVVHDSVRYQLLNSDTRYIIAVSLGLTGCGPLDPHEPSFQEQTFKKIVNSRCINCVKGKGKGKVVPLQA
jgi:hypothetical protein